MYELIIHDDATADLRSMMERNRSAAIKLARFLQELRGDQDLLDRLTQNGFGGRPNAPSPKQARFNTGIWVAAQDQGMNLWRMRHFEVLDYRVIYAFFAPETYTVLGIVEKAEHGNPDDERFDYELDHPITKRIKKAYQALEDELW
ncbi:MAG: hypothetical protein KAX48_00680 [Aeromonas sp.]|nr:hypothetical protein [Aeromonas sp.]